MTQIPIAGPSITQKEIDYVTDAVTNAWYSNANLYHGKFECAFADYVGVKYAVSLPSCTAGIHLALAAFGVGPGDEVIVPDATWIASAAPISYVGATPIFADIDPLTWCLSADSFEAAITVRTKAVIPVDLYGGMPNMDAIRQIARKNKIAVIEDAAEAIGSQYNGRNAGGLGDVGLFSFHGSKTLTTGEGGMLVTDREDIYERVLCLRDHGRQPGDQLFWNQEVAFKYKMSSMQAALGLAQLERIDELVEQKRQIFSWYQSRLGEVDSLQLNHEPSNTKNSYWMVTAIFDPNLTQNKKRLDKNKIWSHLKEHNIASRPFFSPLSSLPAYADLPQSQVGQNQNKFSYAICPYGINLPSAHEVTEEQVNYVCNVILALIDQYS